MIHLILPVHNRAETTARFLRCLVNQRNQDYRVLLVDDGCRDGTVEIARSILPAKNLQVLQGDGQLWWAGALQLAYLQLFRFRPDAEDTVVICNDDMILGPEFLSAAQEVTHDHPDALTQAIGYDFTTLDVDCGAVADLRSLRFSAADSMHPPNCLSTRGLAMRVPVFLASGGFRPKWLPHYLSDYEFTLRLARRGAALRCDQRFEAKVSMELTGQSHFVDSDLRSFWAAAFSNRAKYNPTHWTAFVLLACPLWTAPYHITKIWLRFLRALGRAASPFARKGQQMKSAVNHE